MDKIGDRIRWIVEEHLRVPQVDFARKMKISRQLLSRWINDPHNPPGRSSIAKIAAASGITASWIEYGIGDPLGRSGLNEVAAMYEKAIRDIVHIAQAVLMDNLSARDGEVGLDASPDPQAIVTADGDIVLAGARWASGVGLSGDDVTGVNVTDSVRPEDQERMRMAFSVCLSQDAVVGFEVTTTDDRRIAWRAAPYRDDNVFLTGRELPDGVSLYGNQMDMSPVD
jgi:transcriptional regulator with XRE-family HTH domain